MMKEIEQLLHQDRLAGVPKPPDALHTVLAIKRRLAIQSQPLVVRSQRELVAFSVVTAGVLLGILSALALGRTWMMTARTASITFALACALGVVSLAVMAAVPILISIQEEGAL